MQIAFFDHALRGTPLRMPAVTYVRDPAVPYPPTPTAYPPGAWYRRTASSWPPPGTRDGGLSARRLTGARCAPAPPPVPRLLAAPGEDEANDPVARSPPSRRRRSGTSPIPSAIPASNAPGLVAAFSTDSFPAKRELAGAPVARLSWTPLAPDTQLVLEAVRPRARRHDVPDHPRGGRRPRSHARRRADCDGPGKTFSQLIRPGHRLVAWVLAGDAGFDKLFAPPAGACSAPARDRRSRSRCARPKRLSQNPACAAGGRRIKRGKDAGRVQWQRHCPDRGRSIRADPPPPGVRGGF